MPTKVKNLIVTKVDFVDAGANQRANITLTKRRGDGGATATPPTKGGENMGNESTNSNPVTKFISGLAKAIGLTDAETSVVLQKRDAHTFNDTINQITKREIFCQIWEVTDALGSSLCSIIDDKEVQDKNALMKQSVDEFTAAVKGFIDKWTAQQTVELKKNKIELSEAATAVLMERAKGILKKKDPAANVEPDNPASDGQPKTTPKKVDGTAAGEKGKAKGETEKEEKAMNINKALLTSGERAFLEEIEKKAGVQGAEQNGTQSKDGENVAKNTDGAAPEAGGPELPAAAPSADTGNDGGVFKGIPAEIVSMLQGLQKRADEADEREMLEVAKKYEILGKKAEDLAPVLKSLKKNDPASYDATIGLLDQSLAMVQGSGMFAEIGKRGMTGGEGGAWAQIEKKAAEIRKAAPDTEYHESIDMACQQNPDLVQQYEAERG